jgi:hypothetical protein
MLYDSTVPQFTKTLRNLKAILAKGAAYAESKKIEPQVLPTARLAPDQFTLIKQVQIACDTAKFFGSRLTGKEAPAHADKEATFEDLQGRIESTISYLNQLTAKDFAGTETKPITTPRWEGKWLTGSEYAVQYAIPNFYFHVTVAYEILRHNGVEVGKKDYLGEMPYKK